MSKHTMRLAERQLPQPDPTQPNADVVIDGEVYLLCFDVQALGEAEEQLVKEGWEGCLLMEINRVTIRSTHITFTAAGRKYQPWLTLEDVIELLNTPRKLYDAAVAIADCWNKCAAPKEPTAGAPEEENPSHPS